MWDSIKTLLKGLLQSKKFFLAAVSILLWLLAKANVVLDEGSVTNVLYAIWILIGGIALQDFGKEKAKLEGRPKPPA
jgi:uncharacterized membrane protein